MTRIPADLLDTGRRDRIREMLHIPGHQIIYSVDYRDGHVGGIRRSPGRKRTSSDQEPAQLRGVVSSADHLDRFQRGETGAGRFGIASGRLFDHK